MLKIKCIGQSAAGNLIEITSSETIQRWSKLQEKLKSTDKEISNRTKSAMLRKISL